MKNALTLIFCVILFASSSAAVEMSYKIIEKCKTDGEQLYSAGDFGAAQKTWEVGLDIAKSAKNQKDSAYFFLKLGQVRGEIGDYDVALNYLEGALKAFGQQNDESGRGSVYLAMSRVYAKHEDIDEAVTANQKAMEIFKDIGEDDGLARGYLNAGEYHYAKHDYTGALSCLNESRRIAEKTGNKELICKSLSELGVLNRNAGYFEKAIGLFEESLKVCQSADDKKDKMSVLTELGLVYYSMGDYKKAVPVFEESLDIAESLGEKTSIGNNLAYLGKVYGILCDYGKAVLYLDNSVKYYDASGSKLNVLESYKNLGSVYKSLGYCKKAQDYFEQALNIFKEVGDKSGLADTLIKMGVSCSERGQYSNALTYYQQAIEARKSNGLHYQDILARFADACLDMGDIKSAEKYSSQIKDQLRAGRIELYNKNYTSAAACFEEAIQENTKNRNSELLFPCYCGLAESDLGLWEYDKAKEMFDEAVKISEAQRESLSADEKHDFFSSSVMGFRMSTPYEGIVRKLMSTNDSKGAFGAAENLKLEIFSEAAGIATVAASSSLSSEDIKREEEYILKVRNISKEMDAFLKNNRNDEYWAKDKELKALRVSHDEFVEVLRKSNPEYAFIKYPKPLKPSEIDLKTNEVLLEFEITDDVSYLFMIRGINKRFTTRTIAKTRDEINELVNKYRGSLKKDVSTGELAVFDGKFSNEVYQILFGESLKDVPKGSTLVIVPDEALGALPFGSLVTSLSEIEKIGAGKYGTFPVSAQYLADEYPVTYAQSATALTFLRSKKQSAVAENAGLTVCDPEFSFAETVSTASGQAANTGTAAGIAEAIKWWASERGGSDVFSQIEMSEELKRKMEDIFPGRSTVLSGHEAKEENFAKLPLSKYRFIVFGTHCVLDSGVPWLREPAIIFSQTGNSGGYDGFLTLRDVMKLNISAEAVALSCCETPTGHGVSGEQAMNMGRAFQQAGCKNILMSLWPVNDEVAASCSAGFLKDIKEGKEPGEALKKAREELRDGGFEHPYYWSSFILVSR